MTKNFKFPQICNERGKINEIHNILIDLGYDDIAKKTEDINRAIDTFQVFIEKKTDKLKEIWEAVELCKNGHVSLDEVD